MQAQQKQKVADKEAEQLHQEKLMEGMVEDPALTDILDVVSRPLQVVPNASATGGGGAAWANRTRGRGRGHVSRGGRGGGLRSRGYGGAQFEPGDLPPRFLRKL